jgi:hypothetical protein
VFLVLHGTHGHDGYRWRMLLRLSSYARLRRQAANREMRVLAWGMPSHRVSRRTRCMAATVARWCRGVLAKPMEHDEHDANARMPCETVPSMPPVRHTGPARPSSGARARRVALHVRCAVPREFPRLTSGAGAQQAMRTRATVTLMNINRDDGIPPAIRPRMPGHTSVPRRARGALGLQQETL